MSRIDGVLTGGKGSMDYFIFGSWRDEFSLFVIADPIQIKARRKVSAMNLYLHVFRSGFLGRG